MSSIDSGIEIGKIILYIEPWHAAALIVFCWLVLHRQAIGNYKQIVPEIQVAYTLLNLRDYLFDLSILYGLG